MKKSMVKKIVQGSMFIVIGLFIFSCSAEKKAEELFEVAEFEEVQFNVTHARELYQEILEKYPDTETANRARQAILRLVSEQQKSGD